MAVTDLTDSLPWWARQGAQGPGATGGPGAAPMGAGGAPGGVGGQPPPGMNQQAWLQYLMQMFSPGSAQAADNPQIAALKAAAAAQANGAPPQPGPGDVPVPPSVNTAPAPAPAGAMPARPAGVSASGLPLQPGALAPGALAQFAPAAGGPIGSGGNVPWPSGGGSMNQTAPPPPGQAAPGSSAPTPGPMATGGASAMGATSNPRFIGIDAPNASPQNSMRQGPQGTALNLAGLFGGGGVNPNVPAANAQPVSGRIKGPLANGQGQRGAPSSDNWDIDENGDIVPNFGTSKKSKAPSNYGPLQRGQTFGYKGGIPT